MDAKTNGALVGRLAERSWLPGDPLPAVGTTTLVSGVNCDVESDQHRQYGWSRVVGYGEGERFICLQVPGCWPTVERTENCWFAKIRVTKAEVAFTPESAP